MHTLRKIRLFAFLVLVALTPAAFAPNKSQAGGPPQGEKGAQGKYAKYIFYDLDPAAGWNNKPLSPEEAAKKKAARPKTQSTVEATHFVNLDTTRSEGAPYVDFVWLWKGSAKGYGEQEHTHDFDEFIGFIGSKGQKDPHDLGGEMEVWLGGVTSFL
jgi:hypothetical protein